VGGEGRGSSVVSGTGIFGSVSRAVSWAHANGRRTCWAAVFDFASSLRRPGRSAQSLAVLVLLPARSWILPTRLSPVLPPRCSRGGIETPISGAMTLAVP